MGRFEYDGVLYESLSDACKKKGVKYTAVWKRRNRNVPKELWFSKGIISLKKGESDSKYEVDGVKHPSVKSICEEYGVDKETLRRLKRRYGSYDEAIKKHEEMLVNVIGYGEGARVTGEGIKVFDEIYANKSVAAEYYGIKVGTLHSRLRKGMSLEEALEKEVLYRERKGA